MDILYSFRRCPYAMRARLALYASGAVAGQTYEHREVVLRDKPEAMLIASPKGTVPVLVLQNGTVIDESIDIMRHALSQHDPYHWLSGDDGPTIARNDGPFKHHLDRYKYASRHDADPHEHRAECLKILQIWEQQLNKQAWLSGEQQGLSDAAIMPFIRQCAHTDRDWFTAQELPRLQFWLDEMMHSTAFTTIMAKYPQWSAQKMQATETRKNPRNA